MNVKEPSSHLSETHTHTHTHICTLIIFGLFIQPAFPAEVQITTPVLYWKLTLQMNVKKGRKLNFSFSVENLCNVIFTVGYTVVNITSSLIVNPVVCLSL